MNIEINPKVFLSHASDDKERFVLNFATKLRGEGIDVWLDKWEMLAGDSLVEKIFEEGIKESKTFVIVLSKNSVNKTWVKEELNAGIVKRIDGKCKVIPVVIDDCEVPEALKSTLWIKINDLNNYETEFNQIVNAILENREKPPLGKLRSYAQTVFDVVPSLTRIDSLVLKLSCERANEKGDSLISPESILDNVKSFDIQEEDFYESLEVLHSRGYINGQKVMDRTNRIRFFTINLYGYDEYARTYIEDYPELIKSVIAEIINLDRKDSLEISDSLDKPLRLINHILESLQQNNLVKLTKLMGGKHIHIFNYTPELKRKIRD